ncbi:tripartite tricarboxylate transporter TctB family protein [Falsirhodobacter algicola]|uniref:Tripartite tricarboxylate transporter TctB family protein n=1 Tax=Falsirhodobacter algicola TaxID=2692330 RepID=A0A8J8SMH0_9RHOB|nr:tripartite tricarboxylate transporter TctB family protein [Falsirhodobacter algicola]QUS37316.1 tripartite tricarboxylate transporter TctB family protein [Falsirhodobacter algicola]
MTQRDWSDAAWGAGLALAGAAVAAHAAAHYDIGSLRRMGPGFFPVVLGVALVALGALIALPALRRAGERRPFAWREALAVTAALLVFALLMERAGLIVATALSALIASSVAPRPGLVWRGVLAAIIAFVTWAIFSLALGLSIPVWPWSP